MSTHKHFDLICVAVLLLTLLLTVLFINGERLGIQVIVDEDAESNSDSAYFTSNDRKADWNTGGATKITLKGDKASVSGSGAYAYNGDVIISGAGYFVVSGTLNDGSIIVDANSTSKVWLLFDGVQIHCSDDACLRVDEADKVFLTLAAGSENRLTGGSEYSQTAQDDGTDGVIFAHDDLTINGSGSLSVQAGYKHGISANDDLVITGGCITVIAPADAVRANDSVRICDATVNVNAGDDGIVVNHEEGYLYIESGTLNIISADDAIHTAGNILIDGGIFSITASDDGIHSDGSAVINGGSLDITECYEGIEAVTIEINGGEISVHCSDDGLNANGNSSAFGFFGPGAQQPSEEETEETWIRINDGKISVINETGRDADGFDSNGDIVITGGSIRISLTNSGSNSALDCGSESGGICAISGGDIIACGSYAMAESFDESSAQCSILYNFSAGVEAGTPVSLEDSAGNVLVSYEVPNSFSSVVLSCPEMKLGERYLIIIGDKVEEITLSEISASFGDAASSGFGGTMNWGGMQRRDDFPGFGQEGNGVYERPERPQRDSEGSPGSVGNEKRPGRPDATNGEFSPPDFSGTGTPPDFDGTETPPDFGGMVTPPDFSGKDAPLNYADAQQGTGFPALPGEGGTDQKDEVADTLQQEKYPAETETDENNGKVSAETWFLVILSVAALVLGLLFAIRYKQD